MTRRTRIAYLSPTFAALAFAAVMPAAFAQEAKPRLESERAAYAPSDEVVLRFEGRTTSVMDYLEVDRVDGERLQSHVLGGPAESVEGAWRLDLPEGEYVARWYSPDDPDRAWSVAVRAEATFRVTAEQAGTGGAAGDEVAAAEDAPQVEEEAQAQGATRAGTSPGEAGDGPEIVYSDDLPEGLRGADTPGAAEDEQAEVAASPAGDDAAPEADAAAEDPAGKPDDIIVAAADAWSTYHNARYGTTVSYPKEVFDVQSPPSEGTGRSFVSRDGQARLEIFAWQNEDGETPETLRARLLRAEGYDRVTYKPKGRSWIVLSGFRGKDVFYEKYQFDPASDTVHAFAMQFPRSRKPYYAPILERVEDSFRPL